MADKSHADLLTELQALREENERLREAMTDAHMAIHSEYCGSDGHHPECAAIAAALSPSPAQQEQK